MISSLAAIAAGGVLLAPPLARAAEQGVEELTRGPVHEAFAASVSFDPEPGMFVKTAPPALIEEVPPDQRPEGDNVSWIPGYWGWDDEQSDFIWISGVWRNLPPGRQWVPGYWGEVGSQWQWTSGYWADEETEEVTYVSKPPKSIESGPNVEAPSRNHVWVSGTWINRDDRYAWRPGYWQPGQENWTMTPAHYQWTPRGYVFVDSYWDYNVDRRGVVFAPVHFQPEYYNRPNYSYTPLVVISLAVFADHLFVRPNYGHYYYGDYYAPRYQNDGFYASFSYSSGHRGYDPIYMHNRWQHRDDSNWERGRRENFMFYQTHEDARPPRTWAAMQSRPMAARQGARDNYQFAEPLPQYANRSKGQRFQAVSAENRTQIVARNQQVRKFSQERRQLENRPNDQATEGPDKRIQMKREKFEKSPLAGKRPDQLSGNDAPPKRREPANVDARDPKNPGAQGKAGNNADRPNKGNGDGAAQPENGKGRDKNPDQPRGKNADPATGPDGNNGRPDQKGEPKMKENNQDNPRPERNPAADKPDKADSNPNRANNAPDQPKRQAAQPENTPKKEREPQPQAEQPKRQKPAAEPQRQPEQKQKAAPEPKRQAAPQQEQPKRQKAAEPQRQPEQRQKAAPEPKRQAEPQQQPQRQARPEREPAAGKEPATNKKKNQEEDTDAKKKKN